MREEHFNQLIASIEEAGKIRRNQAEPSRSFHFPEPDVKAIRESIGFSQSKFASLIGVNVRTLQTWEEGRQHPTGPAKVLLCLVQSDPDTVFKNLQIGHAEQGTFSNLIPSSF